MTSANRATPSDVLVLAYHAVSDQWDAVTTVSTAQLERQIRYLLGCGYQSVTFDRALTAPPAGKVLAITFDDAHRSVYEIAFPLLRSLGTVATVFAPTDFVGTGRPTDWEGLVQDAHGPHAREMICMDWDELRTVADARWEVGSHTCSHPHLTRLSSTDLRRELVESRQMIEQQLDRACRTLAYPYSDVDARVVEAAGAAGYAFACTIPIGHALSLPLRWSRVGAFRNDSPMRFRVLTSRACRGFLATATGTMAADLVRYGKGQARRGLTR